MRYSAEECKNIADKFHEDNDAFEKALDKVFLSIEKASRKGEYNVQLNLGCADSKMYDRVIPVLKSKGFTVYCDNEYGYKYIYWGDSQLRVKNRY